MQGETIEGAYDHLVYGFPKYLKENDTLFIKALVIDVQVKSAEALQAAHRLAVDKIRTKSTSK